MESLIVQRQINKTPYAVDIERVYVSIHYTEPYPNNSINSSEVEKKKVSNT